MAIALPEDLHFWKLIRPPLSPVSAIIMARILNALKAITRQLL